MKIKILFLVIATLYIQLSLAQLKPGTLIDDARYFKRTMIYPRSLELFKKALKDRWNISDDYYYAVKVALLNDNKLLAFQWLDDYTKIDSYRSMEDITSDSALFILHSDSRWSDFLSNLENRNKQREERYNQQLKKELDQLYFDDQDVRIKYIEASKKSGPTNRVLDSLMKRMVIIDSINIIKVSSILDKYGWLKSSEVGEKGNTALFGVLQHADLKTQQKYYPLVEKAFKEGNISALLYSEFVDRVRLREGKKQLYGMQYGYKPNSNEFFILPLIDPDNIDKRRLEIGLGHFSYFLQGQGMVWDIEEYKKNLPLYEKWSAKIIF